MRIVVAGGSGLVGTKLVARLQERGHEAVAASRRTGFDTVADVGLEGVLAGADVLVDVTNAPSFEEPVVSEFFRSSTRHLLAAAVRAGVSHYLVLSVVGTPRLQGSAYFRAKAIQEDLMRASSIPHTLVQATQFFEFMANIIPPGAGKHPVYLSPAPVQPIAADDAASLLAGFTVKPPANATLEIAGPERFRLNELVQWVMYSYQDDRPVIADPHARYYGGELDEKTLMPDRHAMLGATTFREWLDGYLSGAIPIPRVNHPNPMA